MNHHQNLAGAMPVLLTLQPPASLLSQGQHRHLYPPSKKEDLTGKNESTLLQPSLNLKYIHLPWGHDQIPHPVISPILQAVAESEGFVALLCNVLVPCTLLVTRVRAAVNVMLHRKASQSSLLAQ